MSATRVPLPYQYLYIKNSSDFNETTFVRAWKMKVKAANGHFRDQRRTSTQQRIAAEKRKKQQKRSDVLMFDIHL